MNKRDIVIGFVILIVLAAIVLSLRRGRSTPLPNLPSPTPVSGEQKIESSFKINIPDDVEKADLKDVSGSDGIAIATRKFENNTYTATVLADVSDPKSGAFYQAWVTKGDLKDTNSEFISLGKLKMAKGGWMIEFQSKTNYSDYKNVLISLESTFDSKPETHVLEGSF